MKKIIKDSLFTFILFQLVISSLQFILGPISILISSLTNSGRTYNTVLSIIAFALKFIGCFVLFRIKVRDSRKITTKHFIITLMIALLVQFIIALIFRFTPIIAGDEFLIWGTRWANVEEYTQVPIYMYLALYPTNILCIFGAATSAFGLAKRRQKKDHNELVGHKS